ncbi:MAG: hypothetical protein OXP12_03990 [Thaumarchaeota archaeon]|nr:hypothetical protein [Nitrososphaerota archaeon]
MIPVSICKTCNPKAIVESCNVHYFYWPLEVGLGHVKIMGKGFPISPVKQDDWEPIKTIDVDGKTTIVSRFHYDILLYFNRPKLDDGKPVIDFLHGSHTPMAYSESGSSLKLLIRNSAGANGISLHKLKALYFMYEQFLRKTAGRLCETKSYEPKRTDIEDGVKLDPTRAKALIVVGEPPTRSHLERIEYLELL